MLGISGLKQKQKNRLEKYPRLYDKTYRAYKGIKAYRLMLQLKYLKRYQKEDTKEAFKRGKSLASFEKKMGRRIAFLITEYEEIHYTGDKYSAISLGTQLKALDQNLSIAYYVRDPRLEWGNIDDTIDYVVLMDPDIHPHIMAQIPNKKIIWIRGNLKKWLKTGYLDQCQGIFVSSEILQKQLKSMNTLLPLKGVVPLGVPIDVQRQLGILPLLEGSQVQSDVGLKAINKEETMTDKEKRRKDIVFVGNIYEIERPVVKYLDLTKGYDLHFYGTIQDPHHPWQRYNKGPIRHDAIVPLYQQAKIVIEDIAPFNKGTVNLRVFEAAACGAMVIANEDEALRELFGERIVCYKNRQELNKLLDFYLTHPEKRVEKVNQLKDFVLTHYLFENSAKVFYSIIKS